MGGENPSPPPCFVQKASTMRQPARSAPPSRRSFKPQFTRTALVCAIGHTLAAAIPAGLTLAPVAAIAADATPAAPTTSARKSHDIPPGPLEAALNRYGREAGILLSYPTELTAGLRSPGLTGPPGRGPAPLLPPPPELPAGRRSPGLTGSHSVQEALPLLLQGTGLVAVAQPGGGWALVKQAPPQASVAAPKSAEAVQPVVTVKAAAERETATGPVAGYAARRSATATKTDVPLLETPQSIAIVGAEQIADQKATNLTEALAYTPGVITDPGYANSYDVFYSRGFRIQDGTGGVYRDGLKLGGSGWATGQQEPYGLERVELLKGAASVLFGAAAPGGVLNVVTKQPQPDHVNEVLSEVCNPRHRALAADLGGALSEDVMGRIVLLARDADTSVDHIPNNTRFIAPSLRWTPNQDTSLTLMAHVTERRTAYIWGVPVAGSLLPSPYGKLPRERFVGEPGFDRQDTTQSSLGLLLTHQLAEGVNLHHGMRWIYSENHIGFTNLRGPDAADPRVYQRRAFDELETTRGLSADTRVQAEFDAAGMRHKAVAGLDPKSTHLN